jgi:hypothetical protein
MAGIQRIADSFGLTPRRVQQLAKEPGFPKVARGDYDEVACLRWYVKFLQEKLSAGTTRADGQVTGRERYDTAKAEIAELELAEKRKQILTVADYEQAMTALINPARHELLAIEARLRPTIGAEAAAKCGSEIKRSLRALVEDEVSA